jgi:hypothetical protein
MKIDPCAFLPKARSEGIIIREVDGELLLYDRVRDRAHCLNETAAAVWKLCDGRTTASVIAKKLMADSERKQKTEVKGRKAVAKDKIRAASGNAGLHPTEEGSRQKAAGDRRQTEGIEQRSPDERFVWLALDQLRGSYLLKEDETNEKTFWPPAISVIAGMSRREAVRRIGLGAAIALPLVISITAPTPAEAAVSCGATCHPCNSPVDCCGVCSSVSVPGCGPTTPRCT